ncbi:Atp-dependent clp protease, atp-binding subunit clpx, partial [Globisporangium polare]
MIRRLYPDAVTTAAATRSLLPRAARRRFSVHTGLKQQQKQIARFSRLSLQNATTPAAAVRLVAKGFSTKPTIPGSPIGVKKAPDQPLCCPQCGSSLALLPSGAEAAAMALTEKDATAPTSFKEGDVVKCSGCSLQFAVKSASSSTSKQTAAAAQASPQYRNAAAAAALSSLPPSFMAGNIQARGSSIGG